MLHEDNSRDKCDTPVEERVAACAALIETEGFEDLAQAYSNRGYSHKELENFPAAIEDLTKSLELRPDDDWTLGNRAFAHLLGGHRDEALADAKRLVEIDPEDYWSHYALGRMHHERGEHAEAVTWLANASKMNPDHYWSHFYRAKSNARLEDYDHADADFSQAAEIEPFYNWLYYNWGSYMEGGERHEEAIRALKIATLINPNYEYSEMELNRIVQEPGTPPALSPHGYTPPDEGMRIRYLEVTLPEDPREDIEKAIDDLINWFSAVAKPEPEALAFVTRQVGAQADDGRIPIKAETQHRVIYNQDLPEPGDTVLTELTLNGLLPAGREQEGGAGRIRYDGNPGSIWPLEVGNTVEGDAVLELVCGEELSMRSFIMGCKPDIEAIPLGRMQYSLQVEAMETILVPMGLFDTYVVRFSEISTLEIFGANEERRIEYRWWIAPERNFWVRRTRLQDGKVLVSEATELLGE